MHDMTDNPDDYISTSVDASVAVLVANQSIDYLWPLSDGFTASTLPVGGKTLLHHCVEECLLAGFETIHVILSPEDNSKAWFGEIARWGANIKIDIVSLELDLLTYAQNYSRQYPTKNIVVARTHLLRIDCLRPLLVDVYDIPDGIYQVHNCLDHDLDLLLYKNPTDQKVDKHKLKPASAMSIQISDLYKYYIANIALVSQQLVDFTPNGYESNNTIFTHHTARVDTHAIDGENILIGPYCRISSDCAIGSDVILNADVFVDKNTTISNSVILPGTYIGRNLTVENSIVWGNCHMRVDLGVSYRIVDDFILSSTPQRAIAA